MKDGIYKVNFDSNQNDYGDGIISVSGSSINGGDYVCYYQGVMIGNKADLRVVRHNKQVTTVFGNLDKLDLDLSFTEGPVGITFTGNVKGQPELKMVGTMTFLDDLV
ncbi:GrlR family regulatory protein [Pantoea sp. Z09]|uniref:GrlR family regulatory protein n=1 Tax=Pantoea sp. Z09 TaxID=2886821 RepID=UPI001EFE268F|nr:GrlR family regulatory protein [Pantoea sp. Z09]